MFKIYHILFITLLSCLCTTNLKGQKHFSLFQPHQNFQSSDSNKLFFRVENLNYVKNNEYSGDFRDGETFIGYLLTPKVVYYPTAKLRVEAGARLQKYSGVHKFSETSPVFNLHYQPNEHHAIIMGNLNQNNNHRLSEPLFNPERFYTNSAETGIQYLYSSPRFRFETWLNWEQFIFSGDPFSEEFSMGFIGHYRLNRPDSDTQFSIPFQNISFHKGGEIDTSEESVNTLANFATGLQFKRKIQGKRVKEFGAEAQIYFFVDNSSKPAYNFDKGHAFYPNMWVAGKNSIFSLGYWNAYKFVAPKGSQLFQSVSLNIPGFTQARRELLTAKYTYEKNIGRDIHLGARINLYHDLKNNTTDYDTAIYISFNQSIFLKKISNTK